ncbi:MAG: hypothetical protein V7739_09095 [Motiliproteus sp.]
MFERTKNFFRDIRINLDFPKFERQCRLEHNNQADRRYSTKKLDAERKALVSKIESEANSNFGSQIKNKKQQITRNKTIENKKEKKISLLTRYYKQELGVLYERKDDLFSKKAELYESKNELSRMISDAFDEKNNAYEELNYCKDQIDSWYAKSDRTPWLSGNSGKKLPKHSLFGQSFGDLDSYKYARDSAFDDVTTAKSRIGNLKQEQHTFNSEISEVKRQIDNLIRQIGTVKEDRGKMYELKKEGFNKNTLQKDLDEIYEAIKTLRNELVELESGRREYVISESHTQGVKKLESNIRNIEMKKEQFIKIFDLEENHQNRIVTHRKLWLRKRTTA